MNLNKNLYLNRLSPTLRYRHGQWGNNAALTRPNNIPVLTERYDLIVGSDLLYERKAAIKLAGFIHQHAKAKAEVWIVDANRGYRAAFSHQMARYRFLLKKEVRLNCKPCLSGACSYRGRLLKYLRKK